MNHKAKDIVLFVLLALVFIVFISEMTFINPEKQQDRIEQKLDQLLEKSNVQSQ